MTVAMMLPSSILLIYMIVDASQCQQHPRATQAAFLGGYVFIWTLFAIAAFIGDTILLVIAPVKVVLLYQTAIICSEKLIYISQ